MYEYDRRIWFCLEFIVHDVFATGTVDKPHLFVMSENHVELLTNFLPWTPVKLAQQYVVLLLKTAKFWVIDLLADFKIEIESE